MIAQTHVDRRTLPKPRKMDRLQKIVEMASFGMTLHEIGQEFGITRERVRQILDRERRDNPDTAVPRFARRSQWVSIGHVSNKIGGKRRVAQLIESGKISPIQIGWGHYIDRATFQSLLAEWEKVRPRCSICRKIVLGSRLSSRLCMTCYGTRRGHRLRNEQAKMRMQCRAVVHANSIHEKIAVGLKRGSQCHLSFSEACQASGLTQMQLQYARNAGLISTKETNRRNRSGGFVCLYSGEEMMQIAAMMKELENE